MPTAALPHSAICRTNFRARVSGFPYARDEIVTHTPSQSLQASLHRRPTFVSLGEACGNDSSRRPTIARPTTIVHWTSQHGRSCTRSHSPSDETPSPRMPLVSCSPEVGGVLGVTPSQEDKGPFAFTPSQLSLLDSKDLGALEAIGGVESLLRGLGTDATRGLLIGAPGCGCEGHSCSQCLRTKGKRRLVEPHTLASIICDHADDRRDPYNVTLQERKRVFGENFLPPCVKESWLVTLMDKALFRALDKNIKGVRVVRNGVEYTISVGEVVVGDIALLAPGEIISCDGIFLFGRNVTCDESTTTELRISPEGHMQTSYGLFHCQWQQGFGRDRALCRRCGWHKKDGTWSPHPHAIQ
ncbi:hypothetical protein SCLCIDRAFT_934912 [Scleroderma citrinum Foug A]|uniref:P-type ATPase A domain-containing protein n=1 Tax=Scleroderma citrinum Foug A TaxID=1036808 RepID=A0A0C2ZGB2_9AGAM|nr:hypothetical protein SCLCIDRAFT_934912 [Scleroderma citrinum Foug A]